MGKNNKKRKSRSVRRTGSNPRKNPNAYKRNAERSRERESRRAELRAAREKKLSEYLLIRSDDERPEIKSAISVKKAQNGYANDELDKNLKRISLSEIQRYAKTSAAAYDKAYGNIVSIENEISSIKEELSKARVKKDAEAEEKAAAAEKRNTLKAKLAELQKRLLISRSNAEALERSSDEYAYIIALLTGEEPSLKKMPRLKDKRIDLTREDERKLVESFLQSKKPRMATEPSADGIIEENNDVKTLMVLGSDVPADNNKKENIVSDKESVDKKSGSKKWIIWPIAAVIAVIAVVFGVKGKAKPAESTPVNEAAPAVSIASAEVKAETEPVAVETAPVIEHVAEESVPAEEEENILRDEFEAGGITIKLSIDDSQAEIEYPASAVSSSDIVDFFAVLAEKYPDYLSSARYSIDDGIVEVNTPFVLTEEDKNMVASLFRSELQAYIDQLNAPYAYKDSFYLYDTEIDVEIGRRTAAVYYPEYITDSDVLAFIAYAAEEYPVLNDYVTYSIGSGRTDFSIPFDLTDDEMKYISDIFGDELISYLEILFESGEDSAETAAADAITDISGEEEPAAPEKTEPVVLPAALPDAEEKAEPAVIVPSYNNYRTSLYFKAGVSYLIGSDSYQNYAFGADFESILKTGNNFGFGIRVEGSMDAIPYNGDYSAISSVGAFFDYHNWMRMYLIDAKLMAKYNSSFYDAYAGVGIGYALCNPQLDSFYGAQFGYTLGNVSTTLSTAFALTAAAGVDFHISDSFYIAIEAGYKHMLPASKGYLTAGVAAGVFF